jgi:5-formyltetrahydrofolate cyclo-ligase
MSQSKKEQRADLRRVLSNVDPRWVAAASRKVAQQVVDVVKNDPHAEHVLAWIAHFPGEVDLTPLISECLKERKVYLPRISVDGQMEFYQITQDWSRKLTEGPFGIPEVNDPSAEKFQDESCANSAICIPGLGFDLRGGRLGRGRGYYDRFLGRPSRREFLKIGICWELQVIPEVCFDSGDVPVQYLVTEDRIHRVDNGN